MVDTTIIPNAEQQERMVDMHQKENGENTIFTMPTGCIFENYPCTHYLGGAGLVSTDGKEFCFLDPSYTTEKFKIPERAGKINEENAPFLYTDVFNVDNQIKPNKTKYHLFARKK